MKKLMMAAIAAMGLAGGTLAAEAVKVSVANVAFRQRYPWNGLVDITCDVAATDATAPVMLWTTAKDNATGQTLPMDHVWLANDTSKTNALIVKAGKAHLVWDAGADCPGTVSKKIAVGVQAYPAEGLRMYMVIDLSSGAASSAYPISYLDRVPEGGWTDEYKTDKLVLRLIQPGTFLMGSPEDEVGREVDETQHLVTITKPYYIGVFEVTQLQYYRAMDWKPGYWTNDAYPVERLSWDDIHADSGFISKLRKRTGLKGFDLPTEAQWEYACRAGTTTSNYNGMNQTEGNRDAVVSRLGRYYENRNDLAGDVNGHYTVVGSYAPNAWGLYDMYGNVAEWCLDYFAAFTSEAQIDPVGSANNSDRRVYRGGGWGQQSWYLRSASRDYNYGTQSTAGSNSSGGWGTIGSNRYFYGFRLCCNPEQK